MTLPNLNQRVSPAPRPRWRRRFVRAGVGLLLLGLLLGGAVSWVVGGLLVASANRPIGPPPVDLPCRSITIVSESGCLLSGWHVESPEHRGVVILVHGIHNSRLGMVDRAKMLRDAGYSVLLFDLQAHGESPGARITLGHLEQYDVRAAVNFAREHHPGEPVALLGVSLGGAAALLASPLPIDALIVESAFPTISEAIHNRIPAALGPLRCVPAWLLLAQIPLRMGCSTGELCPIDHLRNIECPVFIMSGAADQNTTQAETERLFHAATDERQLWLVPEAGHVDLHQFARDEYERRVREFLEESFERKAAR